ncbi:putative lovastatin nonaketide synthase [Bisporella sp. PMI_857]|nr:putative lovastatin nonaketide synthase [Bisporella sp. PMI_857]
MEDKLEPIAIIGMSCRFPGEASSIKGFWDLISNARSAWTEVPANRFNVDSYYHPSPERQGAVIARGGYFMKEDPGLFDAPFFSMTSTEAAGTDPQQRWLLEVAYEAFENDYQMMSNRISWFYDLRGPSMTVDTACSSSLVALHLACQSIRARECKMAVVGGTNLMLQPEAWRGLSSLRFMSPDGKSHSFDAQANGYGRGEGLGLLILKPLSQALEDGDTIRSVIRGSGINQDGKTPGITVPNSDAQRQLIESTYAAAGLGMDKTNYFEAHGTGTPIGDPLELSAAGTAMLDARAGKDPLLIGSVKPNVGHLEGGAGIAGIIKSILSMEQGMIPAVAEFEKLNPRLALEEWGLKIPTTLTPWPPGLRRASINSFGYGGTNAHAILDDAYHYLQERGLKGNHMTSFITPVVSNDGVMDEHINALVPTKSRPTQHKLFCFSTPVQGAAARLSTSYVEFLQNIIDGATTVQDESEFLSNLAHTLNHRRTVFDWRSYVAADSVTSLLEKVKNGFPKLPRALKSASCAFVFTGQGAQWHAMGKELQSQPVFRASLEAAELYLTSIGCHEPQISQSMCANLQVALVDLLRSWGLQPKTVVGHSSGEIAAAYSAGILTREDAWKVAYFRGVFSASIPTSFPQLQGAMSAVALSESAAQEYLKDITTGQACVACINSPLSVTISGDQTALLEVESRLQADNVWFRRLKVGIAYHSPHMSFIADDYLDSIADIKPIAKPVREVKMFSSLTGSQVTSSTDLSPKYWISNMLSPVRFSTAVINMLKPTDARSKRRRTPNINSLVELGPHSALQAPLNQILLSGPEGYDKSVTYASVLRRGCNALETAMEAAGKLWGLGQEVDLQVINAKGTVTETAVTLNNLPSYPWNHEQRYWFESAGHIAQKYRLSPRTDLLGLMAPEFNPKEPRWYNYLKPLEIPWLLDHNVQGTILFPGAAMMAMAVEAAGQVADKYRTPESFELKNVRFTRTLSFQSPDHSITTSFQMRPYKTADTATPTTWNQFTLYSVFNDTHIEHCNGLIRVNYVTTPSEVENGLEVKEEWKACQRKYKAATESCDEEIITSGLYEALSKDGFDFGPTFRNLTTMHAGTDQGCVTFTIPNTKEIMPENFEYPLLIHPCTLDAALQVLLSSVAKGSGYGGMTKIPTSIESFVVSASLSSSPGTILKAFCFIEDSKIDNPPGSVYISDDAFSEPLITLKGITMSKPSGDDMYDQLTTESKRVCTLLSWVEDFEALSQETVKHLRSAIDSGSDLKTLYGEDDVLRNGFVNSTVSEWFNMVTYKFPGLRVLEIGNGSVSTAVSVLQKLAPTETLPLRASKYTYTESTEALALLAKAALKEWEVVDVAYLDVSAEPASQGFVGGSYDVVLCTGLSKNTADLTAILKAAKVLLRNGGTFVGTITHSHLPTIAVLNPEEIKEPLPIQEWDTILRSGGFTGAAVSVHDSEDESTRENSIILSTLDSAKCYNFEQVIFLTPDIPNVRYQSLISKISKDLGYRSMTVSEASLDSLPNMKDSVFISFADLGGSPLQELSGEKFEQMKRLFTTSAGVIWVTNSNIKNGPTTPSGGIAAGLFRTLRAEAPHLRLINFDFSSNIELGSESAERLLLHVFDKTLADKVVDREYRDNEFAEADGRLYVPRMILESSINSELTELGSAPRPQMDKLFQPDRPLKMEMGKPGLLDTVRFTDQFIFQKPLSSKEVSIRVKAVGVNFLDLMTALGQVPSSKTGFGSEVVGIIEELGPEANPKLKVGDTVVAVVEEGFSTHVRIGDKACQHLPEGMSETDAVSCVVAYITAYCCLIELARLSRGESVLIHAAAGGVGQAAIQLAQYIGVEIFATVGSTEKKALLTERYGIPETHIFNSRDLTFAKGIKRMTKGNGVDVILNSTHGEALRASWDCLADFGRFVEIGKRDILENNGLEMKHFLRNCQFIGFNLQQMNPGGRHEDKATDAHANIFDLLRKGVIKPLYPVTIYPFSQFEQAFRALQSGTVCGKIVLQAGADEIVPVMPRVAVSQLLDSNSTYVLVGGLGGIGRALAHYLVSQGARHLAFISRSGATSDEAKELMSSLSKDGIQATALACDISKKRNLSLAIQSLAGAMPKIRGAIQCAMVLRDGIFDKMTYNDWTTTTAAKIQGSWNLHELLPTDLDFFVLLASTSGVIGNPGQANYAAGCAYQDQLAHYRRRLGMAATSLDLGAVTGVGYLAENTDHYAGSEHLEAMQLKEHELYALLGVAIRGHSRDQNVTPPQVTSGIAVGEPLRKLSNTFEWGRDSKLSILRRMDGVKEALRDVDGTRAALMNASTILEAAGIIEDALCSRLAKALAISIEDINANQPMHSYGVDSLVAVEVRNWLIRELQADISVFDILGTIPISTLAIKITETSKLLQTKRFDGQEAVITVDVDKEREAEDKSPQGSLQPGSIQVAGETQEVEIVSNMVDQLDVNDIKSFVVEVVTESEQYCSSGESA